MNSKFLIGVIVVLLALLGWSLMNRPADTGAAVEPSGPGGKSAETVLSGVAATAVGDLPDRKHAAGNANRRTWVVYRLDQPGDVHVEAGDALRFQKTGNSYKMIPMTQMRNRWKKPTTFVVDLVEGPDEILCGMVNLPDHDADEEHLYKFETKGADELEIRIDLFDSDETLEEQCDATADVHGGRAHAEN